MDGIYWTKIGGDAHYPKWYDEIHKINQFVDNGKTYTIMFIEEKDKGER
jgi:hypothetical protein